MKVFMFCQYMFGIHSLLEAAMYWSTDPLLRVSAVADVISKGRFINKGRFQKLSQDFHWNDNSEAVPKGQAGYDPLFKVALSSTPCSATAAPTTSPARPSPSMKQ